MNFALEVHETSFLVLAICYIFRTQPIARPKYNVLLAQANTDPATSARIPNAGVDVPLPSPCPVIGSRGLNTAVIHQQPAALLFVDLQSSKQSATNFRKDGIDRRL